MGTINSELKLKGSTKVYCVIEEYGDCEGRSIRPNSISKSFITFIRELEEYNGRSNNGGWYSYSFNNEFYKNFAHVKYIRMSLNPIIPEEQEKIKKEIKELENIKKSLNKVKQEHTIFVNGEFIKKFSNLIKK